MADLRVKVRVFGPRLWVRFSLLKNLSHFLLKSVSTNSGRCVPYAVLKENWP